MTSPQELRDFLLEPFPEQGQWSEDRYLAHTDDCRRLVEFTDGCVEVLPMPTDMHLANVLLLYCVLFQGIPAGKVRVAPLRLRIRSGKFREPDLLVLTNAADPRGKNRFWTGADLVMEVVSEDRPERDTVEKRADYAEGGITEYWIVEPDAQIIVVLKFQDNAYVEHGVFTRGDAATSAMMSGFAVDVATALDAK